ncbi:MAG: transcriptional repressor [Clostridiales bacterium]|nr:transcriptional repressor [Clostridiales bacterium]
MGYTTKQGENIINLLKSTGGEHLTADEISLMLSERGCAVGKSTVYRRLEKLVENGSVRRFIIDEGKRACYQYVGESCKNHYHLRCDKCGKLLHVDCDYLDKVADHILEHHGFVMNGEKTVIYGTCPECREKEGNDE